VGQKREPGGSARRNIPFLTVRRAVVVTVFVIVGRCGEYRRIGPRSQQEGYQARDELWQLRTLPAGQDQADGRNW
jgi:hypothetical protein